MNESQKIDEWVRYYKASQLKINALRAIYENNPELMSQVLKKLGLVSALDVIKECDWRY